MQQSWCKTATLGILGWRKYFLFFSLVHTYLLIMSKRNWSTFTEKPQSFSYPSFDVCSAPVGSQGSGVELENPIPWPAAGHTAGDPDDKAQQRLEKAEEKQRGVLVTHLGKIVSARLWVQPGWNESLWTSVCKSSLPTKPGERCSRALA